MFLVYIFKVRSHCGGNDKINQFFVSLPLPSWIGSISIHDSNDNGNANNCNGNGKNGYHGIKWLCVMAMATKVNEFSIAILVTLRQQRHNFHYFGVIAIAIMNVYNTYSWQQWQWQKWVSWWPIGVFTLWRQRHMEMLPLPLQCEWTFFWRCPYETGQSTDSPKDSTTTLFDPPLQLQ